MAPRRRARKRKTDRFCIVLPRTMAARLDDLVSRGHGTSRSEMLRQGATMLIQSLGRSAQPGE